MLVFTVYIIQSKITLSYYIGSTSDIEARLKSHNSGANRSTKAYRPWALLYTESQPTRQAALQREKQMKAYKGGRAFKALLQLRNYGEVA